MDEYANNLQKLLDEYIDWCYEHYSSNELASVQANSLMAFNLWLESGREKQQ